MENISVMYDHKFLRYTRLNSVTHIVLENLQKSNSKISLAPGILLQINLKQERDYLFFFKLYIHGHIIKWTQHIVFLTLAGMERVVKGNHGNDLKEG